MSTQKARKMNRQDPSTQKLEKLMGRIQASQKLARSLDRGGKLSPFYKNHMRRKGDAV